MLFPVAISTHQVVRALADGTIILVRPEAVVALHLAIVQGRPARRLAGTAAECQVRQRWAMRTTLARIGRYRVLAGLAHGRLAGRRSVLVADASDAVALFPLLAEFPRDALVNAVLRLLLGELRPGDQIWQARTI